MKKKWIVILASCLLLLSACGGHADSDETAAPAQPKTVAPLPADVSVDALDNCTFAAAFEASDVYVREGDLVISLAPYYTPKYDGTDIASLAVGDTLVVGGENVAVQSIQQSENCISINGGYENDGYDLYPQEDGTYCWAVIDVGSEYVPLGEVTLSVDPDFVFVDNSDPQSPGLQITAGDFLMAMQNRTDSFSPNATRVRTANGKIVELTKNYMP